jgi:hypothetical protein
MAFVTWLEETTVRNPSFQANCSILPHSSRVFHPLSEKKAGASDTLGFVGGFFGGGGGWWWHSLETGN